MRRSDLGQAPHCRVATGATDDAIGQMKGRVMTRSKLAPALATTLAAVMLASCAGPVDAPGDGPDAEPMDDADGPAADSQDVDPPTVDEVLATIAAMGLTYEERLAYLHERAVDEGEVLLYTMARVEVVETFSRGFENAYPEIDHGFVHQRPADLLERLLAEARAGRYLADVIQITASIAHLLETEDLVAEHHGVPIPEAYPDEFVRPASAVTDLAPFVIAWNTDLLPSNEAPRELDDLLEPEHIGCVLSDNPTPVATMIAERGYEETETWLQRFLDNGGIARSGTPPAMVAALAAGEFSCLALSLAHPVEALIIDDGAPLEWHLPTHAPVSLTNIYIHRNSQRPHAAALLMHWILGEGGGQVLADDGRIVPHPGAEMPYERLRPFADPESDHSHRLRLLTPEEFGQVEEQALELIDRYVISDMGAR